MQPTVDPGTHSDYTELSQQSVVKSTVGFHAFSVETPYYVKIASLVVLIFRISRLITQIWFPLSKKFN